MDGLVTWTDAALMFAKVIKRKCCNRVLVKCCCAKVALKALPFAIPLVPACSFIERVFTAKAWFE